MMTREGGKTVDWEHQGSFKSVSQSVSGVSGEVGGFARRKWVFGT